MTTALAWKRNPGLPVVRQPKREGDHEITDPFLKEWLLRKRSQPHEG